MRSSAIALALPLLIAAACGSGSAQDVAGDPTTSVENSVLEPVIAKPSADIERATVAVDAPVDALAAGFNNSGFDLLRTLPSEKNTILSPTSIGHAMLMMRAAADVPSGEAIDQGFSLPPGMDAHEAWNVIDQAVDASNARATSAAGEPTPIVTIADRIWPREGAQLDQTFIDLMATHHGADVETFDVGQPEVSRQRINEWVSGETNQLIPELLPKDFIDDSTVAVLTDAVYFKAQWQLPFSKYGTTDAPFSNIDGTQSTVPFMRELEQGAPRGLGDGWAAAELPYLGGDYSMLVIVPDDFEQMRLDLSQDLIDEIDGSLESGPYELLLPQWETESSLNFFGWLQEMGAAPGDYPAIGEFIDGAVHAAVITVDEVGTEAAAATAVEVSESGPPEPDFTIAADRPFFYLIRQVESGMVLFAGQLTNF